MKHYQILPFAKVLMPHVDAQLPAFPHAPAAGTGRIAAWQRETRRLFLGAAGPVAVAATQFAASMVLWASASAQAFGLFAFVILLIQLSFGLSNALVGAPLSVAPRGVDGLRHRDACLAAHAVLLLGVAIVIPALLWLAGARGSAIAFATQAVLANLRWAARSHAIANERVAISAASDVGYAIAGAALLVTLWATHHVSLASVSFALAAANFVALTSLSRDFLRLQRQAIRREAFGWYRRQVWPRQAGWAVIGVVSTEAVSNAHAYIVTALCGAPLFAPLAFGALFCRPLTIFLTALNQIDRPIFVRHLHAGTTDAIRSLMRCNFVAVAAVWSANLALALGALWWFGDAIAARHYDIGNVRIVVVLWFAIMALRGARNPLSTFLQASDGFRPLARCSLIAATVSIVAVAGLAGISPTYSLVGVMSGELLFLALVFVTYRQRAA